jgi:DNA modification methylase
VGTREAEGNPRVAPRVVSREARDERHRRSLTNVGGAVSVRGDRVLGARLAEALSVASSVDDRVGDPVTARSVGELEARAHVHGFHTYPARMHPLTARRLVLALTDPGGVVLDPFCGSGTVLVEARLQGRIALGSDLNPLAVELATRKSRPAEDDHRRKLLAAAEQVALVATERRKARTGASRRYPPSDVALFDPHVLLELDGLRVGLERIEDVPVHRDLQLVLSSILVKLSRKSADTADATRAPSQAKPGGSGPAPTRIAAGFPTRHFLARTNEFVGQLEAIAADLAKGPEARIVLDDARNLDWIRPGSVDAVVTSPPYAGVYDYLEHHRLRLRWLGLDERRFSRDELGSKRQLAHIDPRDAHALFDEQMTDMLAAMRRVLRPGGRAALLVADSAFGSTPLRIDEVLARVGRQSGWIPLAVASQARPHFHGPTARAFTREPRREHAVLLERAASPHDATARSPGRTVPNGRRR